MATRFNWGIVVFACVFAAVLIGAAVTSGYIHKSASSTADITAAQGAIPDSSVKAAEWRSALEAIASTAATTTSFANYRAPKELPKIQAMSQELITTYFQLKKDGKLGTPAENAALSDIIKRNAPVIKPTDTYTLGSLRTNSGTTLDEYAGTIGVVIKKAGVIREYELATFGRTVGRNTTTGTPELRADAGIYRDIESDLVNAPVPLSIAGAHLTLLKSVAFLAQSTELMANWSGDPLEGIAYIDAFVRADHDTQTAVNALFNAIIQAGKKV